MFFCLKIYLHTLRLTVLVRGFVFRRHLSSFEFAESFNFFSENDLKTKRFLRFFGKIKFVSYHPLWAMQTTFG